MLFRSVKVNGTETNVLTAQLEVYENSTEEPEPSMKYETTKITVSDEILNSTEPDFDKGLVGDIISKTRYDNMKENGITGINNYTISEIFNLDSGSNKIKDINNLSFNNKDLLQLTGDEYKSGELFKVILGKEVVSSLQFPESDIMAESDWFELGQVEEVLIKPVDKTPGETNIGNFGGESEESGLTAQG